MNQDEKVEHNTEYDHEAFLGVEEAKKFDQLTAEESKKRLGYENQNSISNRIPSILVLFSIVLIKIITAQSPNKN